MRGLWRPGSVIGGLLGGGIVALFQWIPKPQGCIESDAPGCPGPVAGHVTVVAVVAGVLVGVLLWSATGWLNHRAAQRRRLEGRE